MAASAGAIRAGSAYVEIFARDGQFQQAMSRIRARMMTLGTQMRQAGTSMTIGGTALGAPFIFAARTAASFSLEMARVRANTGATDQQFASLNSSAKTFAIQFGRAPEEVAGAMSELAKAGLDAEGVMKSISPILAVAAADNMELARAVEVAVSTMAQFGMTTNDFGAIADKLQATANASTTSVDSIGEALSYVGPKAQEAGQSFDDVAAAIATLADAGLRGSLGGTGLARVIESIANEEAKLANLFGPGKGVSTRDMGGQMRPFMDVLEELGQKTANLSNVDRIRLFTDIFEIRGANAAMSLSKMRDKFNDVLGTIENSGGTALGKATSVMNSFGGAVKQLGAQFGVLQIQVIESMGPIATQAVQAFTRLLAVVGGFISRNGTLVAIVAGSTAALFSLGVASLAAGIALQGLATGLRIIQAVMAVIPALFTPIGITVAALGASIAGAVVIARTLSPAFREETDAIMAALMRLDFGAAWEVMNINVAIALVQMHQKFAQAFDLVRNTVIAASQFMGDMLIEGLDRFMGLFGEDILTLQSGFQKLGLYFKAAFDWDFAMNGLTKALNAVDSEVEKARQRAPTEDRRAADRDKQREQNAAERGAAATARDKGFADTIKALREDDERAKRRARGEVPKVAEDPAKPSQPVKPKVPAAPPGAFMPPPEDKGEKDKGLAAQGNFSGVGLDIGPEIGRLEDPAQRTANATERTAEAVGKLAAAGGDVAVPQQDAKAEAAKAAGELERLKAAKQEYDDSEGAVLESYFDLIEKAKELGVVDPSKKGFDALKKELENNPQGGMASDVIKKAEENIAKRKSLRATNGVSSSNDFWEKISDAESALASATAAAQQAPAVDAGVMNPPMAATVPAIAMETVAPRAPAVQANAARGMETAIGAAQTGITFEQVGSQIVAAVNAGTEVSKQMLGALNKIAEKKPTELAFQ
jgi:TP901 family phage tail tape measure protein